MLPDAHGVAVPFRALGVHHPCDARPILSPPTRTPTGSMTIESAPSLDPVPGTVHAPTGLDPALLRAKWEEGLSLAAFMDAAKENAGLWRKLAERAAVPPEAAERACALPAPLRLLVLSEDWCGDSVNTVPLMARLAEASGGRLELRLLGRDAHPELMDAHLTGASRSIPVVMVLDADFRERGWWGPRPAPLQRWVLETGLSLPKEEKYREVRTWYVRDRGATTLAELLPLLERAAA